MTRRPPDASSTSPADTANDPLAQTDSGAPKPEATLDLIPDNAGQTLGSSSADPVNSPASQSPSTPEKTHSDLKLPAEQTDADLGATIDSARAPSDNTSSEIASAPLDQTMDVTATASGQDPSSQSGLDASQDATPTSEIASALLDQTMDVTATATGQAPSRQSGPGAPSREIASAPLDQTMDGAATVTGQALSRQSGPGVSEESTPNREITSDPTIRHTVTRFLAEGGLGKVYVAQDDKLQREVVLKTLKDVGNENSEARYRFVQEAQVNSQLEHPNIIPIYQAGDGADGQPYYTMKYVRGQEFRELIQSYHQNRRAGSVDALELRRLLALFISTCQAVSYAHNRGVVHRDLKPENVAVGEFGELMVLDWGLAKVLGKPEPGTSRAAVTIADEIDLGQTIQGRIMGTPGYMAPEQASGATSAVEPRTDIYALGAILFEILTGEAPHALLHSYGPNQLQRWSRRESYLGTSTDQESVSLLASLHSPGQQESTMKLLSRVVSGTVPAPSDLEPTVPRALEAICQHAMRLKIEDRYTTASDLAADVERWLADEPVSVYAGSWNERLGRWMRKHRTKVQAIGASFAVIALVAVVSSVLINNQKQLAVKESQRAVAAEQNASQEADRAKAAERIASQEAARARAAERIAVAKTAQAERSAYSSDMLLAESDWEDASIRHLTDLLDRYRERQDLKGFEWNYWDRLAASHLLSLAAHTGNVTSVSFSSDGTRLVSGSADTTVKVWDVVTGREMLTFKGHTKQVKSVSFSPDGTRLVSGSADTTVKIWDLATGQEMLTFKGHTKPVSSVSFSPDGTRLASGSMDKTAKLWDALTGEEILTLAGNAHRVTFSPDGSRLATTVNDFAVRLWDTATGSKLLTLPGHNSIVSSVSFSPDGKQLASASWDRTVKLWDATTGQELFTFKGHAKSVHSVSFSPDGRQVASAGADQKVIVWDAVAGQETLSLKGHGPFVNSVVFSPDGTRLASGGNDTNVRVWDAATGQQLLTFKGHAKSVYSVSFSPDGTRLASASWDQTVKVWDTATGQEMLSLQGHADAVSSVRFSPDGKQLASASHDNTVKVWDTATGQQLLTLEGHTNRATCVCFSPDGKWLATTGEDGMVKVWDATTGQEPFTLKGHTGHAKSVTFNRDGTLLASGGADTTLKVWDAATGQETLTLQGHADAVSSVSFSPDGSRLASTSYDNTVKVWDAATGQEVLTLQGHVVPVISASFSPDGKRLATSSVGGLKVWDSRPWTPALRAQSQAYGLLTLRLRQVVSLAALQEVVRNDQTISDQVRQQALDWSPLFWNARQ